MEFADYCFSNRFMSTNPKVWFAIVTSIKRLGIKCDLAIYYAAKSP
jgi:hypothetical protein